MLKQQSSGKPKQIQQPQQQKVNLENGLWCNHTTSLLFKTEDRQRRRRKRRRRKPSTDIVGVY
jgi:hypothetical protein